MQVVNSIVNASDAGNHVNLEWSNGLSSKFHYVWLRDNCKHPSRFEEKTGERKTLSEDIPIDPKVSSVRVLPDGCLAIQWKDSPADSSFEPGWLWQHDYSQNPSANKLDVTIVPWQAEYGQSIKTFSMNTLYSSDSAVIEMIDAFTAYGLIKITDLTPRDREVEQFANWLAYVREIIFDRVADIKVKLDPYNLGFTNQALPLHTDCSGYAWPPNVMAFHCLKNEVKGGKSTYSDGAAATEYLRKHEPEALHTLSTVQVDYRLFAKNADTQYTAPPICLNSDGTLKIIRFANWAVQPLKMIDFHSIPKYYEANRLLANIVNHSSMKIEVRCEPGDMLLINNHRILHGREAFDDSKGIRHFQQVYLEMDDLLSRKRVIQRKFRRMA